jgi:hypothetical protein
LRSSPWNRQCWSVSHSAPSRQADEDRGKIRKKHKRANVAQVRECERKGEQGVQTQECRVSA